ncbi:ankyrin repeat domain-containing protein [bacterium]|nr:ankyrin repeat domain-containing protein [bacterium]
MMLKRFAIILVVTFILLAATSTFAAQIHTAAATGDVATVEKLVKADPNIVNLKDDDGATPLHHAAAKGQLAIVKLLIADKADVNAQKKDGVTALHVAAALGYKDVVVALLDAKADACAVDKKGRTPLSIAKAGGKVEIENIIRERIGKTPAANLNIPQPPPPPITAANDKDIKTLAEEFIDHISKGEYSAATNYLDSKMKSALSPSMLSEVWQVTQSQVGAYKGRIKTRTDKIQGFDAVFVTCQFENITLDAQIAFDSSKQISGFYTVKPH